MLRNVFKILGLSVLLNSSVLASTTVDDGQKFLAENQKKAGIHTTASGLQYKIIQEGKGTPPGPTDFVEVHYRGTLINGKEFDSSYAQHAPANFSVNAVIPGWTEALQLMKPGSKWTVYIPSKLAYGAQGAGNLIGPNETLIFDIELLSVKPNLIENPIDFNDDVADGG